MEGRTGANVRNHQFGICGHVLNSRLFTAETVCRNNHFSSVLETVYRTTTTHLFNILISGSVTDLRKVLSLSLRNCMLFLSHLFTVTLPTSSKKECCNAQAPITNTNNSITWSWLQAVAISPPSCSKGPTLGQWGPNPASCLLIAHPCKRNWESQCNDQCWIHGYPPAIKHGNGTSLISS